MQSLQTVTNSINQWSLLLSTTQSVCGLSVARVPSSARSMSSLHAATISAILQNCQTDRRTDRQTDIQRGLEDVL